MIRRLFRRRSWRIGSVIFMALLLSTLVLSFVPTQFYILRPGSAMALNSMVTVAGGQKDAKGSFMLTTVKMGPASVMGYLYAKVDPYSDLLDANRVLSPHESNEEYNKRELEIMRDSQLTAQVIAFEKAGLPVEVKNLGAIVMQTIPNMPADKVLKVGDVITKVNGKNVPTAQDLLIALSGKKVGDQVQLEWNRDGQPMKATIALEKLPTTAKEVRAGIGISSPITKREVKLPNQVTIQSEKIGGPSAGLMFTLEIINQLSKEDLTKGYRIAGTGEILEDGSVGRIGGIEHKIIAAAEEGVDIFFAPNDQLPLGVKDRTNYEEAVETAKKINTDMKIVPVRTVDDAIKYLEELQPKA